MARYSFWPSPQNWLQYWPSCIVSLIAVAQLIFSFGIVILHSAIVGLGVAAFCIGATPWFIMGFVCWIIFFACWISVFSVTCCNRSSVACATYVMIKNVVAFIFAAVLIDFDNKFINNQLAFGSDYRIDNCVSTAGGLTDFLGIMLSLAKAQLAGSVIMLVSSLVFIGIYIYVYIRSIYDNRGDFTESPPKIGLSNQPRPPSSYQPSTSYPAAPNNATPTVICQNCGATVLTNNRF